jgi:hypothetical protein
LRQTKQGDGEIKDELGIAVVGPPSSVFARNVRRGGNTFENQPTRQGVNNRKINSKTEDLFDSKSSGSAAHLAKPVV